MLTPPASAIVDSVVAQAAHRLMYRHQRRRARRIERDRDGPRKSK